MIKQPNFQNAYQISNRLALVESKPVKTVFNKPIYMGAVILETVNYICMNSGMII